MSEFLVWAAVSIGISIAVEIFLHFRQPAGSRQRISTHVLNAGRNGLLAVLGLTLIQIFVLVNGMHEFVASGNVENELTLAEDVLREGVGDLYSTEAVPIVEDVRRSLREVALGEISLLSGARVTEVWRNLLYEASSSVKATNVISADFWRSGENMGDAARQAHVAARGRGVRISRLYIVDLGDGAASEATRVLADEYRSLGTAARLIDRSYLEAMDEYSHCHNKLSAIDFVIYDESVVLLVNHSSSFAVLSGRLSRRRQEHVDVALACFERWWDAAEKLESIEVVRSSSPD